MFHNDRSMGWGKAGQLPSTYFPISLPKPFRQKCHRCWCRQGADCRQMQMIAAPSESASPWERDSGREVGIEEEAL